MQAGEPAEDHASEPTGSVLLGPFAYLASWTVVWLVQWWLAPTWLVGSRSGLQTALQVLPAVVVAIFVLVLGSLFVLGQQAIALHGARAVLVLPLNQRVRAVVWRPLLITAVALLLSGQVPDTGEPSTVVTSAVATLILATIGVLAYSTTALYSLYSEFTAPVIFAQQVLAGARRNLERGHTGQVVFRAGLLTEMLGQAVTRGDSTAISAALHAIDELHEAYIAASRQNPAARQHTYNDGHEVAAWFAHEVPAGMVAAAMDALAVSRASEDDVDAILDTIERMGERAAAAGQPEEVEGAIIALAKIATCVQQIQPSGAINHPGRTVTVLAQIEAAAESSGDGERARLALAAMMLALAYVQTKFGHENPAFALAVRLLGDDPPFYEAGDILESEDWVERWINKMPPVPLAVMVPISWLQMTIDAHAELHGKPPPQRPAKKEGPPWYMEGVTEEDLAALLAQAQTSQTP